MLATVISFLPRKGLGVAGLGRGEHEVWTLASMDAGMWVCRPPGRRGWVLRTAELKIGRHESCDGSPPHSDAPISLRRKVGRNGAGGCGHGHDGGGVATMKDQGKGSALLL
eukprot:349601-Chlamydomonas_euryale.AAC.3